VCCWLWPASQCQCHPNLWIMRRMRLLAPTRLALIGVIGLNVVGDGRSCGPCSRTNFTYVGSRGKKVRYASEGITFYKNECWPRGLACPAHVQLMIDAGQMYSLPDSAFTNETTATTAQQCLNSCRATSNTGKGCFVQFDYTKSLLPTRSKSHARGW